MTAEKLFGHVKVKKCVVCGSLVSIDEKSQRLHKKTVWHKRKPRACQQLSLGIIKWPNGTYSVRCYNCDEEIPFFFYTPEEWKKR